VGWNQSQTYIRVRRLPLTVTPPTCTGAGACAWSASAAPKIHTLRTIVLIQFKEFTARERVRFQFRAEAYNAFNHRQFSMVNVTPKWNYATGAYTSTQFGEITAARDPRYMQFGMKLQF
jgi:hypothetical protein